MLGSIVVGTEELGALMFTVLVVLPLMNCTRTCGAAVLAMFALTKTRTQPLRSLTRGTLTAG